jgi:hypothetical protein
MRTNLGRIIILGVVSVFITWSCDGYLDQFNMDRLSTEIELTPSIAAPLAYGSFSVQDILEVMNDSAGLISVGDNDLIYLSYADTAFSLFAEELIEIADQITSETYIQADVETPGWIALPVGDSLTFYKVDRLSFSIEPEDRIDSIMVKAGSLNLRAFSEFHHAGILNITSSDIFSPAGDSLNLEFDISDDAGNYEEISDYNLSGYKILMKNVDEEAVTTINYKLTLIKSPAPIAPDEEAGVILTFEDLEYRVVFGYIASREITDVEESVDIAFFSGLDEVPDIYFADPQFNISVHNSFGIPLSLNINNFSARSYIDGTYTNLEFKNDTMNPYTIYAPTVSQIGQSITTRRPFNVETTNIDEVLSSVPDRIDMSFTASSGNIPGFTGQNFLLDTSKMVLEAEVILPIWFRTSGYTLRDTLDLSLDSILADVSFIENLGFRLTTINEWPLELSAQIYFMNPAEEILDSLFQERTVLIDAAPVNSVGELDASLLEPYVVDVQVSNDELENIEGASKMILVVRVVTARNLTPPVPVKLLSSYMLNYQLSVYADFRINPAEMNFE